MKPEHYRVLIVDDNPADRLIYRMALSGFEVCDADQGQTALESCQTQLPDCILLDFSMPGMHGLQFIELLKTHYGDLPCAVVMLTGVRDEAVAVSAMKSGTTDYLPKTETIGEVLPHSVISAIEKYRMRRQLAEQQVALEASEFQYRTLVESLPQLVWLADAAGIIQFGNRRWSEYTGLTSSGAVELQAALASEDRERFSNLWRDAVGANGSSEIELRLRRSSDGTHRRHLIRFAPIHDRSGEPRWLGIATDIEDVKQAELAIQTKQKWESIGLLAGGVAHDFNNLLVGILGAASLLTDSLPAADDSQSILQLIIQSSERAAYLTRQLLAYSGKGQLYIERINLSDLVRKTCDLIRSSIPPRVQLSLQITDPVSVLEADAGQMQQVITNLVMNAVEAIPENQHGTVTVRTFVADCSPESLPQGHSGPEPPASGPHTVLEIQDTGTGMDAETKAKIFDPFFTTRFQGRGLGLAAVQGIVRSAEGRIDVDSALGKGTTLRVFLPIPRARVAAKRPSPPVKEVSEGNSAGKILVIDDEPAVRQMMRVVLGWAGYEVLAAEDGATGLRILEQQQDSVSLVLLDMGMPQMGGDEVLERMRASGCQVPVVICSGYSESDVLTKFAAVEFTAFIQKPFKIDELTRRVNDLLGAVPSRR